MGDLSSCWIEFPPDTASGKSMVSERGGFKGNAGPWKRWRLITAVAHDAGSDEMFVQVIDEFGDAAFERAADADVVEYRLVLDIFTKSDASGVRADGDTEFGRKEENGYDFVHPCKATGVDLTIVDGISLEQLFEHDSIVTMFAGGHADS